MNKQKGGGSVKKKGEARRSTLGFRIMGFFMLFILILVVAFESFYLRTLYQDYYNNVAGTLEIQARYDTDLYLSYLSDSDLMDVVVENKNQFYRSNKSQVQILTNAGMILYDSLGTRLPGEVITTADVLEAQAGRTGNVIWKPTYTDEKVMSFSAPIRSQTSQVGILRLSTSLGEVDQAIQRPLIISLLFCIVVVIFSFLASYVVSRSIIKPIEALNQVAQKLADGQFDIKADTTTGGEIGDLAKTMNFMSDSIQQKDNLKNEFISSVSHELRTPLTSIKGWAVTLETGGLGEETYQEGLKIIEQESDRLSSMVEDLLDFSRFSSGHMELNKSSFDLVEVTENLLAQFQLRAKEKQMDMPFNYDEKPLIITADEDRIKQVLINLLDNAMKFTDAGGMVLTNLAKEEDKVVISITDTGIGIPEGEVKLVTEKFWKGSSSASHTGLGLSICEEIVKAHNGALDIRSKEGVGTTVIVTLPLAMA